MEGVWLQTPPTELMGTLPPPQRTHPGSALPSQTPRPPRLVHRALSAGDRLGHPTPEWLHPIAIPCFCLLAGPGLLSRWMILS